MSDGFNPAELVEVVAGDLVEAPVRTRSTKNDADVGRAVRQWWKKKKLGDVLDGIDGTASVTLAQAIVDVGVMSAAHLLKRLADPKAPMKVKDQIALTMAPRLVAEARGRLPKDPSVPKASTRGEGLSGVLQTYRVRSG